MHLDEYQAAAARTHNAKLSDRDRLLDAAAGLAEEAGEVLGLVRKELMQQRPADRSRLHEELGDALWCIAQLADALGIKLEAVGASNLEKLRRRHPDGFKAGESPRA